MAAENMGGSMNEEACIGECETLVKGLPDELAKRITSLVHHSAAVAKAGNLTASAEDLETVREILVKRNHFRRYDNDIWVFTAIIRSIRRQSSEEPVPNAFERFMDSKPSWTRLDQELSRAQRDFWYGSPDAPVGGEFLVVLQDGSGASGAKKDCFIATAAYGSSLAPEVEILRVFRDTTILPSRVGQRLVNWYYRTSPRLANWIERRPFARMIVRILILSPILVILKAVLTHGFRRAGTGKNTGA